MEYITITIESDESKDDIQIERELFEKANQIFEENGLTFEQAIVRFFEYVVEFGFPFTGEEIRDYMFGDKQ